MNARTPPDSGSAGPADPPLARAAAAVAVIVFCLVSGLSAIIEALLIPVYVGSNVLPVTIVIAVVLNFALPPLLRVTVGWRWATALPLICWIVVAVLLGFWNTSRSILVPGPGQDGYVALGFYFGGALAGFVSVLRETNPVKVASARP